MNISQIKERGLEIEQHGKLPKGVLEIIYEHQLFKLFVATELGGKNLDLLTDQQRRCSSMRGYCQ